MRWKARAVGVVLLLFVAVWAAQLGDLAPYVVGGLLVAANVGTTVWAVRRRRRMPGGLTTPFIGPLVTCWLAVTILPAHTFSTRSSASAVESAANLQPLLELVLTGAVGVVSAVTIRTFEPTLGRSRPPLYLFPLGVWVMASAVWSASGPYAFVRGLQMFVFAALAWATVAIGRHDLQSMDLMVERFLRRFVWVTLALCALGVALGPRYVTIARSNRGRFTWMGAHPTGSGLILAAALVIVVASPAASLRMKPLVQAAVAVALTVALYDNHSRAAWLGLAAALVSALVLRGIVSWVVRRIGVPVALAGAVIGLYYHGGAVWEYLLRDRDSESLATGNGRRELWAIGFRSFETPFDWLFGHGYGIARTMFLPEAPWAGEAHNSVLAVLVSTGVVGVVILLGTIGRAAVDVVRARLWGAGAAGAALACLAVLAVADGMTADILAEPHVGYSLLLLVGAFSLARLQVGRAGTYESAVAAAGAARRSGS